MKQRSAIALYTAAIIVTAIASHTGAASYIESSQGDISSDRFAPTQLVLAPGNNIIAGNFGPSGTPDQPDLDYITITVPPGTELSQVILVNIDVGGAASFIGVQRGAIFTEPWDEAVPQALLGWAHYGSADRGLDILPRIGAGSSATGFTPPLAPDQYTFWIMELDGARQYSYTFNFIVSGAPACEGDFNGSGGVDFADITFFLANFGAAYNFGNITTVLANFGGAC